MQSPIILVEFRVGIINAPQHFMIFKKLSVLHWSGTIAHALGAKQD